MKLNKVDFIRLLESDAGEDELVKLLESVEPEAIAQLAIIESRFGDEADTILNNLYESGDVLIATKMICLHENIDLQEFIVKRVTSQGVISRVKDRRTRTRLATQTTGMSKAKRKLIARRAAKTKRANPSGKIRALRKRKRAMNRRKTMGL